MNKMLPLDYTGFNIYTFSVAVLRSLTQVEALTLFSEIFHCMTNCKSQRAQHFLTMSGVMYK